MQTPRPLSSLHLQKRHILLIGTLLMTGIAMLINALPGHFEHHHAEVLFLSGTLFLLAYSVAKKWSMAPLIACILVFLPFFDSLGTLIQGDLSVLTILYTILYGSVILSAIFTKLPHHHAH
jgi:hypothetical protein